MLEAGYEDLLGESDREAGALMDNVFSSRVDTPVGLEATGIGGVESTMEVSEIDEKQEDQWFKIKTPEDLDA